MSNPPIDLASLAAAVTAQTTAIANFVDQQILLYTSTDPTVTVTDANGNPVVIPSWYATVGANQAAVGAMQAQVAANTAAILAIDTGDTTINASITALQTLTATQTTNITTLQGNVASILSQQTTDVTNITALQSQVASLQAGGTSSGSTIAALQAQVNTNTTDIANLQTTTAQNATNITALQTSVTSNSTLITSLQTGQTANTNAIGVNSTNISANTTAIGTLQTQQATNTAAIGVNAANIQTNTTAIGTLNTTVSGYSATIASLQDSVNTVTTNLAANNTSLTNLQTSLTALQTQESSDIASVNTKISANISSINALNTQVANLPLPGAYSPPYVSNRFFTQVFTDVDGRLLGGISRASGKLWLNNGGWLSERLDELEAQVKFDNLVYNDLTNTIALLPPSKNRYTQLFGSVTPSTLGQNNAMAAVYGGFTNSGSLEVGGVSIDSQVTALQAAALPVTAVKTNADDLAIFLGDSTLTGLLYENNGFSSYAAPSQTSTQLAARVAATPVLLSVTNRQILASGATTVSASQILDGAGTLQTVYPITVDSVSQSIVGTLAGIQGTLTRGASDSALTFTASVALTAPVYIGDATPFIPEDANTILSHVLVIAVGRNNLSDLATVKRDIQAIVAAGPLVNVAKRFLIVTPFNYAAENNTTPNGLAVIALEQWIQFTYPNNSFNTRQFLQNTYAALGAADAATYFGNGLIPASYFTADNQTLTATAKTYLSYGMSNALAALH